MVSRSLPDPNLVHALEQLAEITDRRQGCLIINATVDAREMDDGSIVAGTAFGALEVESDRFSDAAILWAIFDRARFWTFCDLLAEFFCQILRERIPLRAGVSVGLAHMDKAARIYVGKDKPFERSENGFRRTEGTANTDISSGKSTLPFATFCGEKS